MVFGSKASTALPADPLEPKLYGMLSQEPFVCPRHLLEKAGRLPTTPMALAGADGAVALQSARLAYEAGLILPWLVGDRERIAWEAKAIGWDIGGLPLQAAGSEAEAAAVAIGLARAGEVSAVMKGQVHTDLLMKAVLNRDHGIRGAGALSHAFYMTLPNRPGAVTITDAAVNVAPDCDRRLAIARNAVALHHALGELCPKVAVLSATEVPIPSVPSSLEAAEIVSRARAGELPDAEADGPMALDLALSPQAAEIKGKGGPVAGQADILLVPNIETGNALFKSMVYLLSANAAGLVLGARVPIVLTSRADPPEARLAAAALAAIQAEHQRQQQ